LEARKLLPALTLAVVMSLALLVWYFPPTGDFRIDNPFWNGLTDFRERNNAAGITSLADLPADPGNSTLIVIPYVPLNGSALSAIRQFVVQGGVLLIMDDYGYGNQVLEYLGAEMRFTGERLMDPIFNYRNAMFPRASDLSYPLNGTGDIALNHATSLTVSGGSVSVIVRSSEFSFLDTDGNSARSAGDPSGPLPVAGYQKLGDGCVIAVADPSIIINSMAGVDGNSLAAGRLVNLDGSRQVIIDQSHLPKAPLDDAKLVLAVLHAAASTQAGSLALITLIATLTTLPLWRRS